MAKKSWVQRIAKLKPPTNGGARRGRIKSNEEKIKQMAKKGETPKGPSMTR